MLACFDWMQHSSSSYAVTISCIFSRANFQRALSLWFPANYHQRRDARRLCTPTASVHLARLIMHRSSCIAHQHFHQGNTQGHWATRSRLAEVRKLRGILNKFRHRDRGERPFSWVAPGSSCVRPCRGMKLSAARSPGTRRKSALCLYTDVGSVVELARMSEGE